MKKDILLMLERKKLGWSPCAVSSSGESFVNLLTDCLWYLDGHYELIIIEHQNQSSGLLHMRSKKAGVVHPVTPL